MGSSDFCIRILSDFMYISTDLLLKTVGAEPTIYEPSSVLRAHS